MSIIIISIIQVPELPSVVGNVQYYILYNAEGSSSTMARIFYPGSTEQQILTYTLTSLTRDTEYTIQIRVQIRYSPCSTYVSGNYSDSVSFRTNATSELWKQNNNYNVMISTVGIHIITENSLHLYSLG